MDFITNNFSLRNTHTALAGVAQVVECLPFTCMQVSWFHSLLGHMPGFQVSGSILIGGVQEAADRCVFFFSLSNQ